MIIRRKINGIEYPILLTPEELKLAHEIYEHREYVIYYRDILTNKDNPEFKDEKEFKREYGISKEYILENIEVFVNIVIKKIKENKEKYNFSNNDFSKICAFYEVINELAND